MLLSLKVVTAHLDGQHRVLGEGGFDLKAPEMMSLMFVRLIDYKNSLSKHGIQLLGDIVLLVRNPLGSEVEDEVGVGLAVDVHRVEVVGLHHVGADKHPDRLVAGEALQQVFFSTEKNFFLRKVQQRYHISGN